MELVNIIKDYMTIRKNYRKLFSLCHENSHYVRCLTLAVLARLRCLPTLYLAWRAVSGIVTLMRFVKPSLVQILLEDITKIFFNFSALVCGKRVILTGVNDAPLYKKHALVKWKKQKNRWGHNLWKPLQDRYTVRKAIAKFFLCTLELAIVHVLKVILLPKCVKLLVQRLLCQK